jgi:DNA-directed RNA polymerase specialized sigma24 family protein
MDWKTFLTELTKALAWPTTVIVLAFVLRTPVASLARLLRKLKYGDVEAEFGEIVESARRAVLYHEVTKEPLKKLTTDKQQYIAYAIRSELDRTERLILLLHHYENLSFGEIAAVMDMSEEEVAGRFEAAKQKLRTVLKAPHHGLSTPV